MADGTQMNINVPEPTALRMLRPDGGHLFTIYTDGTVDGNMQDAAEAAQVFVNEASRLLAAHDRAVKAEAWDEGYRSGHSRAMRYLSDEPGVSAGVNPYRDEATK